MKKRDLILIVIGIIIGVVIFLVFFNANNDAISTKDTAKDSTTKTRKILYWKAPMNPSEVYNKPGKSAMGMDLVPVYEDLTGEAGVVKIDPVVQQNMNVKTEVVESKRINPLVITNGILQTDERTEFIVTTKVGGWVEKLYVNFTGQEVKKGEKLIDIYSPILVAAEQEFLTAIAYGDKVIKSSNKSIANTGKELIENSIRKLQLLDVSMKEIEALRKNKIIKKYMTLYAPFDGTVINKKVIEGQKINPGTPLLKIADLKNLWLIADIYEYELSKIKLGAKANIKFNFLPSKVFKSKITFIYPTLDANTRTIKVRFDMPNYNNELKPSMFATVEIEGIDLGIHPVVPEQAIIRSGQNNIIILEVGKGKFKPINVKLGNYSKGYYQVLEGLTAGNIIVTSAQFLIDSESNLKAALNQFMIAKPAKKDSLKNTSKTTKKYLKAISPLIREGVIDLEEIDKNKDGKLYQDIMDWNVISDKPGVCPECGMTLRKFTIKEVEENLKKHGYKFK